MTNARQTASDLLKELGAKSSKLSGMNVWRIYEVREYEGIKARTNAEVDDIIAIAMANALIRRCRT